MLPILAQTGWDRPGSHAGFWRSPGASHSSLWSWARWRWKGQLAQGLSAFPVRIHSFLLQYLLWKGSRGRRSHTPGFTQSGEAQEPLGVGDGQPQAGLAHHAAPAQTASGEHLRPGAGGGPGGPVTAGAPTAEVAFQEICDLGYASSWF